LEPLLLIMSIGSLEQLLWEIALRREAFLPLRKTFGKETTFFCPFALAALQAEHIVSLVHNKETILYCVL